MMNTQTLKLTYPAESIGGKSDLVKDVDGIVEYKSYGNSGTYYLTDSGLKVYSRGVVFTC